MKFLLVFVFLFVGCSSKNDSRPEVVEKAVVEKQLMFDGHCPNGLCLKMKVKGDGQFKLEHENKIYFFSSQKALDNFSKDIPGNIEKAEKNWKALRDIK